MKTETISVFECHQCHTMSPMPGQCIICGKEMTQYKYVDKNEYDSLIQALIEIRDFARQGLRIFTIYPTEESWLFHKCNVIASEADSAIQGELESYIFVELNKHLMNYSKTLLHGKDRPLENYYKLYREQRIAQGKPRILDYLSWLEDSYHEMVCGESLY